MDIPIQIDGRECGRLELRREGAYTVFSGRCEDPGRLVRLAVYGEDGAWATLGVMAPEGGALTLRRRLSRAALRNFPAEPKYAAPAPEGGAPSAAPQNAQNAQNTPGAQKAAPLRPMPGGTVNAKAAQTAPPETPQAGAELLWYRAADGSLYTTWNGTRYRAIPMAAHGLPLGRMVEKRRIEGVDYAVFEEKNGSIFG